MENYLDITCIIRSQLYGYVGLPFASTGVAQIKAIDSHKPVRTWLYL